MVAIQASLLLALSLFSITVLGMEYSSGKRQETCGKQAAPAVCTEATSATRARHEDTTRRAIWAASAGLLV